MPSLTVVKRPPPRKPNASRGGQLTPAIIGRDHRRAARWRQRPFRAVQSRIHFGRCRQSDRKCHTAGSSRAFQHPFQRSPQAGIAQGADRCPRPRRCPWRPLPYRLGAVQCRRVPDRARSVRRCRRASGRRGHEPDAAALDLGRHLGCPLHQGLLPGRGIRARQRHHAQDRRAGIRRRSHDAHGHLSAYPGSVSSQAGSVLSQWDSRANTLRA